MKARAEEVEDAVGVLFVGATQAIVAATAYKAVDEARHAAAQRVERAAEAVLNVAGGAWSRSPARRRGRTGPAEPEASPAGGNRIAVVALGGAQNGGVAVARGH